MYLVFAEELEIAPSRAQRNTLATPDQPFARICCQYGLSPDRRFETTSARGKQDGPNCGKVAWPGLVSGSTCTTVALP